MTDQNKEKESSIEYIERICKEKNVNIEDLLIGAGPMIAASFIIRDQKVKPLVKEYAELSKKLAGHYQKALEELDDDELLLKYIEKCSLLEEALEWHISLGALNTKVIQTIRARKEQREREEGNENRKADS